MKMLKGHRTRIFGTSITILGVVEMYAREVIPAEYQGAVLMTVGIVVVILRELTTTPPGKAE